MQFQFPPVSSFIKLDRHVVLQSTFTKLTMHPVLHNKPTFRINVLLNLIKLHLYNSYRLSPHLPKGEDLKHANLSF